MTSYPRDICILTRTSFSIFFVPQFEEAEQSYEAGDWTAATNRLFECQQILKDDKPARNLINVMSRFNFHAPADWAGSRHLTEK